MHRRPSFRHLNIDNNTLKSYHVVVDMPELLNKLMQPKHL